MSMGDRKTAMTRCTGVRWRRIGPGTL